MSASPDNRSRGLGVFVLGMGAFFLALHHYAPRTGIRFARAEPFVVPTAVGLLFVGAYGAMVGLEPLQMRPIHVFLFLGGCAVGWLVMHH